MSDLIPRPTGNLADLVAAAALRAGPRTALRAGARTVSWAELDARVAAVGGALHDAGLERGDRVLLALPNTPEFAAAYFGTLRAGLVAVPVNPEGTPDELGHQITDSAARAVLAVPGAVERLGPARLMGCALVSSDVAGLAGGTAPAAGGGEDLAVLLYTGGTSGRPRAAMLPHRALLANLEQLARLGDGAISGNDVVLGVLPFFHVYGLNAVLGAVARAGATAVLAERFDPVDTLADVRRHGVTYVLGAPPMYVTWAMLPELAESFAGVRVAVSGAAPLPPETAAAFHAASGLVLQEGYGLTEAAPVVTTTLGAPPKPGSVGRAIPGVELRVGDAGAEPDAADPGEVALRGDNLFAGYWPGGQDGPDADGWFPTGDVGYLDGDGDLFLVDRLRDVVIVSGFNVYPREVEQVLATHPAVAAAAVVGVAHPYTGETVKAFVVARADRPPPSDTELIAYAGAHLARFKCPTVVEFVDELPAGVAGKPLRRRLRALRRPRGGPA